MAGRKRVLDKTLADWNGVNQALMEIGEAQDEIAAIEMEMNVQINQLKDAAKEKIKDYEELIKLQELMICQYTKEHREELKGKSYRLPFGKVGFRLSTKIVIPKETKPIIESLKKHGMMDCLNTTVTINKEVLRTYAEKDILQTGAKVKKEDVFWYEIERETVQDSKGV